MSWAEQVQSDMLAWIERVSEPRRVGDLPICPYAAKARRDGRFTAMPAPPDHLESMVRIIADRWPTLNKEIVILATNREAITPEELEQMAQRLSNDLREKDLWVLDDHADAPGEINGVNTGNGKHAVLILQGLSDLNARSKSLAESTDYYSFWTQEYLEKVVSPRLTTR